MICPFCHKKVKVINKNQKYCFNPKCRQERREAINKKWRDKSKVYFKIYNGLYKVKSSIRVYKRNHLLRQLRINNQRYESNFQKLQKSVGSKKYTHYCERERKLNERCVYLQKLLKINIAGNPCWDKKCYYNCQKTAEKRQCALLNAE